MPSPSPESESSNTAAAREKYAKVVSILRASQSAVIAYSGGVDSALLVKAAHTALGPQRYLACLLVSPSLAGREKRRARELARRQDFRFKLLVGTEFQRPAYVANGPDRCFHCKTDLFEHLEAQRRRLGFRRLLFGANADDSADYRPGHKAAAEARVGAPLAEAGMGKREVRQLARELGLPVWDKPAKPCLSSRIPYGLAVTPERLARVEQAESLLEDMGFETCRVRHDGGNARIEIPVSQFARFVEPGVAPQAIEAMRRIGFSRIYLDLEGLRSGNLNQDLTRKDGV